MALQRQPISLNFAQGLDTKSDPYQIPIGKFANMQNSVFTSAGRLTKRNGFKNITNLPNPEQTTLTTLNGNLLATGSNLYAYSADTNQWLNKGVVQPISLSVQTLVRVSTSQTSPDTAVASSGLICLVYIDSGVAYYQISDSSTGQQVISRMALQSGAYAPRVFLLGQHFVISYLLPVVSSQHLVVMAIPTSVPDAPLAPQTISNSVSTTNFGYDGAVANNNLYFAYAGTLSTVKLSFFTSSLLVSAPTNLAGHTADYMSVSIDTSGSTPVVYATFWDAGSTDLYTASFSQILLPILAPTLVSSGLDLKGITSLSNNNLCSIFLDNNNTYGAGPNAGVRTDFVSKASITSTGTVITPSVILRSVGLASKAFLDSNTIYMLVVYGEVNQPTYFLIDSTGAIYMRLAYSNGGGYAASQVLPSVNLHNNSYQVPYLIADFLTTVNKNTNNVPGLPVNAIYTQTGINLATFSINTSGQYSSEIANTLHLTGGQLWQYDGVKPVEHGFQVWPENQAVTTSSTGGNIGAGTYYYQFTYEWTDNQGNLHRSAPSIPIQVTTTGTTSENTLYVPTLRMTYKIAPNPVRIVGYRWSVAQQVYYQFTSITNPIINNPSVDYVVITDTLSDASILGQNIIYTNGGVLEDIAAPASVASALFSNRLFLIDAEDRNLLWFSKQVIEAVPVEMSDLLTLYVAPTSGAQGSTGPMTALAAMDDKLIIFKKDAIYYINGLGPDNTGANSSFSDPIFITSAVGCPNPSSIVLMPNGLMFQSDKGIWLLGRDLSTTYVGAPVELYNSSTVMSAQAIPGTNQVRFVLANNITLMYDYYFNQWGTFTNKFAISSTLYQGLDTYLNSYGGIYQETTNTYLDGSDPVLMSITTGWISVAGMQGYERFYFGFLLGTYFTPFKLNILLGYDYNQGPRQQITITPDNYVANWGGEAVWGSGPAWGGPGNVFEARFFPQQQKCETFQVTINEQFDGSLGASPGQGLTLSGMNLIMGIKKGYRVQKASRSFG